MKRILSIFLIMAMLTGTTSVVAFAATATRVTIRASRTTVSVGKTIQLEERVYPDELVYDHVTWLSSDEDVVEVDNYGEVLGIGPGTATITCRVFDSSDKRIGSGYIDITVPGARGDDDDKIDTDSSSSKSSSSSSSSTASSSQGKVSAATVTSAVRNNVVKGKTTSVTFKGYDSVSAATLQSAALEMKNGGGTVLLNFDTMNAAKTNAVEGRITINPASAASLKGDINLGVRTNENATGKVRTKFQKYFKNKIVAISASQKGNYGMSVTYAVKIGSELANSKNLMLYSYNPDNNKYYEIKNPAIWLDSSGYVHFTTNLGDYLIVSDGKLARK